ncbi:hypothetical protein B1R32_10355 [Abditibacterium utsteinense]|uniref:Uncharacterized protein n=1 Tax=Abditibacterium utsteinense TaxID=1960156 RepID=A0A2S8SVG8_9BACT|nr:hypothetical protein [Abditibacterium utsteinense]PQV64788.1 hypothetical protein B1R32_10355 [Abditibacterium utsteinense]
MPTSPKITRVRVSPRKKSSTLRRADEEVNLAPVAWGRRVARLVGDKFGVQMVADRSKNEGARGKTRVVIKCAKSRVAPIFVLTQMLSRVDEVWGIFLIHGEGAQVWSCDAAFVRRAAYFSRNAKVMPRAELRFKAMQRGGTLIGNLSEAEIESCHVP